ncbi:putative altered inheritance of mitochondria protein mitochondrial [Rosellinia necatrix]|uniref:Altered inheritance of mitochondria protein 41 n=1 Tax=Rosellinia necatrix TaxID=77044 RepID=A0A1W2TB31_ROSNE|nr:putative altered inheritance of mitochondria protein mitochondrial [Rosellinia necatrix]
MSLRPGIRNATNLLRPRVSGPSSCTRIFAIGRSYSDAATPPLLLKLKADLKTAMREKDAARLTVLRGVIASTLNASKTSSPITTDVALVALLRKQARGCTEARDEFAGAGRDDLAAKEEAQIAVLNQYMAGSGVEELSEGQLQAVVKDAIASLGDKPKSGDVMKALLAPEGPLKGKAFEKAELARVVKEVIGA